MNNGNKRYLVLSVLALTLLLLSFFYYENRQKKLEQKLNGGDYTQVSVSGDPEQESSFSSEEEAAHSKTTAEGEATKGSTTESTINRSATETSHSPQTMKEPLKVDGIVLVNKQYPLPDSYDPGENQEALKAFKNMNDEMQALGLDVSSEYSGYRSYRDQEALYRTYVETDGQEEADRYSSRPGYSEHQTGLAFDFINTAGELLSTKREADWIAENAHRFGFIVRYKEGQEAITGYMAEAWHVRYVGKKAAAEIKEKGVTLEEYLGMKGGDYTQ